MFKQLSALLTCLTIGVIAHAQETFPQNGAYDESYLKNASLSQNQAFFWPI